MHLTTNKSLKELVYHSLGIQEPCLFPRRNHLFLTWQNSQQVWSGASTLFFMKSPITRLESDLRTQNRFWGGGPKTPSPTDIHEKRMSLIISLSGSTWLSPLRIYSVITITFILIPGQATFEMDPVLKFWQSNSFPWLVPEYNFWKNMNKTLKNFQRIIFSC